MTDLNPKPFLEFSNEDWQKWLSAAVSRTPLPPYLALGRDIDLHHAIRALYLALPTDESRCLMLQGLGLALTSTPVLPTDERTVIQFFYLFHLAALLKPPTVRAYLRSLLKSEVFSDARAGQTNLHCLLVAVCAKFGVDSQLVRDLQSSTDRIRGHEYSLACFRTLALGSETGTEACIFLEHLVPQLSAGLLPAKLQVSLELCARLHGLSAIDVWYQRNEPLLSINSPKELAIFEGCLTGLIYSTSVRDLADGVAMQKRIFEKYGPESLFTLITSKAAGAAECVSLLVKLRREGLRWSLIDTGSLRSHRKMFKEADTALCVGLQRYLFDPHNFPAEYAILAGAADSCDSPGANLSASLTRNTKQVSATFRPDLLIQ